MSGGHWGFSANVICDGLEQVSEERYIITGFPELSKIFDLLAPILYDIIHDLDYDISGDCFIMDKVKFQKEAVEKLRKVLNENK
ncbi:hypothetical protein LCGC14_0541930 [marine sediment metagenome]|uniref:Uncharacterized protein n=1 Tax=marine sediment metagenome TaxID=412755 RepID=A0A0F9UE13_9ZZZZ